MKLILIFLLFLIFASKVTDCLEIMDYTQNKTVYFPSFWHIDTAKPSTNKYIIYSGSKNPKLLNTCKFLNPSEYGSNFTFNGAAILVVGNGGCLYSDHTRIVQNANGSLALIGAGIPFIASSLKNNFKGINIPAIMVSSIDALKIWAIIMKNGELNKPTIVYFKIEKNLWLEIGGGGFWIFLEVIVLLSYLVNYILGIRGLYLHIKKEGLRPSIAQLSLWVNLAGVFIFSMLVFDPWNVRYIASQTFVLTMVIIFSPFLLTSIFLLSFFFNEILIAKGFMKPQLNLLKIPFGIVCVTCWSAYIADAVLVGLKLTNVDLLKTITLCNVLFYSVAMVYFISVTVLILIRLKNFDSPILKRIIPLVTTVGFGIVLFVSGAIIEAIEAFGTYYPRNMIAEYTLYFVASIFIYTPQFIFFREPSKRSQGTSSPKPSSPSNKLVQLTEILKD